METLATCVRREWPNFIFVIQHSDRHGQKCWFIHGNRGTIEQLAIKLSPSILKLLLGVAWYYYYLGEETVASRVVEIKPQLSWTTRRCCPYLPLEDAVELTRIALSKMATASTSAQTLEVCYSTPSSCTTYSLLELSPAMLANLSEGVQLDIVGQPADDSVMTTANNTLALRAVRSSNTMLLCQPLPKPATPESTVRLTTLASLGQTLDLIPVKPRIERIEELLRGQEWSNEERPDFTLVREDVGPWAGRGSTKLTNTRTE